jgi:hypothetical protein
MTRQARKNQYRNTEVGRRGANLFSIFDFLDSWVGWVGWACWAAGRLPFSVDSSFDYSLACIHRVHIDILHRHLLLSS